MALFKKNKKENNDLNQYEQEMPIDDGWIRDDYILVNNKTRAKDLKPYQRLVVLRKPDGEQKCIVDNSLSYRELKRIQGIINEKGYVDINDESITRIIPNEYKTEGYKSLFSQEQAIIMNDVMNEIKPELYSDHEVKLDDNVPIIKFQDANIKITTKSKNVSSKNSVEDVDIIDSVDIYIPHEERNIKWDDEYELYLDNERVSYDNSDENPYDYENYDYSEQDNQEFQYSNEGHYEEEFNHEQYQNDESLQQEEYAPEYYESDSVNQYDAHQPENVYVDDSNQDYVENVDYVDTALETNQYIEQPKETVTSFFKNEVELNQNSNQQRGRNYYKFYEDNNTNPIERVVFNKKINMFTMRKKIDKKLIDQLEARNQNRK